MRTIVSIVSHRHHDVLINLETMKKLASVEGVIVLCRDNVPVKKLKGYCEKYGITYLENLSEKGFAENNNLNFRYYQEHLAPESSDRFLILNPDVLLRPNALKAMLKESLKSENSIVTADLFLDKEYLFQDDNVRRYPRLLDFLRTYLLNQRATMIDRAEEIPGGFDCWSSGACMMIKSENFWLLRGFDERFYLYCEDIDLCRRAKSRSMPILFCRYAKGVHFRRRDSKRFLTRYFFWHVASVLKYVFSRKSRQPKKSSVLPVFSSMDNPTTKKSSAAKGA